MTDALDQLMRVYSQRGFADWKNAGHKLRTAARHCLANAIVENNWEIHRVIDGRHQGFIPMPKYGYSKELDWCFFWPRMVEKELRSLVLFVLVKGKRRRCIAFRFEGDSDGPHGYTHTQLTLGMSKTVALPHVPTWLPVSYPAFPLPAQNWTELFLAMATAVHGRYGGIDDILQTLLATGLAAEHAAQFNEFLEKRLPKLGEEAGP